MASPPRLPRGRADARPHPILGSYFRTRSAQYFPCVAYAAPPTAPNTFRLHYNEPQPPHALPLPQLDCRHPRVFPPHYCVIAPYTYLGPVEGLDHTNDSTYILVNRWWVCIWTSRAGGTSLVTQVPVHIIQDWIRNGWHIGWDHWFYYSRLIYPGILKYARRGVPLPHLNAIAPLHLLSGPAWLRLQTARLFFPVRQTDLYPYLDFPIGWRTELESDSEGDPPRRQRERLARRRVRFVLRRMVLWHRAWRLHFAFRTGTLRDLLPQLHTAEPALVRIAMFAQPSVRDRLVPMSMADLLFGPLVSRPPLLRWLVYERQRAPVD